MDYLEKSFNAVCQAIGYISKYSDNIFLPIKPTYAYDLIYSKWEETTEFFIKVKVFQTKSQAPSGSYVLNLRKSGGYENAKEHKAAFDPSMCDVVFAMSPEGFYMINSMEITQKRAISLSKFQEYKCMDIPS